MRSNGKLTSSQRPWKAMQSPSDRLWRALKASLVVERGGSKETSSKWREKVHAVKLSKITPARIAEWKKSFLAKYPPDPVSQRKARISVNSLSRRAKSLYAPKYLSHLPAIG